MLQNWQQRNSLYVMISSVPPPKVSENLKLTQCQKHYSGKQLFLITLCRQKSHELCIMFWYQKNNYLSYNICYFFFLRVPTYKGLRTEGIPQTYEHRLWMHKRNPHHLQQTMQRINTGLKKNNAKETKLYCINCYIN